MNNSIIIQILNTWKLHNEICKILIDQFGRDGFCGLDNRKYHSAVFFASNIIVIFSDMIQESDESSFAGPRGFTREEAHAIIERLRFSNRIPDLRDCRVFVNGGPGKSNLQVGNIKNFWVAYFKETQAELAAYDYDAGNQITSYLNQRLAPSGKCRSGTRGLQSSLNQRAAL